MEFQPMTSLEIRLSSIPAGPTVNAICPDLAIARYTKHADIAAKDAAATSIPATRSGDGTCTPNARIEHAMAGMSVENAVRHSLDETNRASMAGGASE